MTMAGSDVVSMDGISEGDIKGDRRDEFLCFVRANARLWLRRVLPYWPLILPALLLLPALGSFPYPSAEARYSDVTISHYPNTLFLRRTLAEWHTIPLWSSTILSGYPFVANPLSGLWYPPGWLAILLPLPLGFNLLVLAHLLWGGLGMMMLLQAEGLSRRGSVLGGLAFTAMPKLFAHYGGGHLSLIYAVSWTPWLLIVDRYARSPARRQNRFLHSGCVLALGFLADPRWALYAGLAWSSYSIVSRLFESGERSHEIVQFCQPRIPLIFVPLRNIVVQSGIAALLSAPLWMPMLEYVNLSTRANLTPDEVLIFSLPPSRLLGLLFPDWGGFHEWVVYPGAIVLILAALSALVSRRSIRWRYWLGIVLVSILISLGRYLPLFDSLARLPGFDLLRVPSRAMFLSGMGISAMAAYGLDKILESLADNGKKRANLFLAGVIGFTIIFGMSAWYLRIEMPINFIWGLGVALAGSLMASLMIRWRVLSQPGYTALLVLCVIDLAASNRTLFSPRPPQVVYAQADHAAHYLANMVDRYRIYSPSYSLPQHTAARYNLELADGVDPLQIASYVAFMQEASGIPNTGYSITLPPYSHGEPANDNRSYIPNARLLGLLSVRFVLSEYDLPGDGIVKLLQFGSTRVYENRQALPRAWILESDARDHDRSIDIMRWSPNQIVLQAAGPGRLVLSEVAYPGWQVSVDGQAADLEVVNGFLRGVHINPGIHRVIFSYRPASLGWGLFFWLIGVLFWFFPFLNTHYE